MKTQHVLGLCGLAVLGTACGVEFDAQNAVTSVRVLAVQKSSPNPAPGQDVSLSMLWHDGRSKPGVPARITWFGGCNNPPGDLYYLCFPHVYAAALALDAGLEPALGEVTAVPLPESLLASLPSTVDPSSLSITVGSGPRFSYHVPEDIISGRATPSETEVQRYGVSQVFFAACAGRLASNPEFQADLAVMLEGRAPEVLHFPLRCLDADGKPLGNEDFMVGYSTLYSYEDVSSHNPDVKGLLIDGEPASAAGSCSGVDCLPGEAASCTGESCQGNVPLYESGDCADYAACIPVCDEAKSSDCPTHDLKPILDEAQVSEEDTVFGGVEQVWVRYYSTRSVIVREPRLVADSTLGVLDSYGTTFRAPKTPGPFHLWAVVQDERGGVGWARATVLAR